MKKLLLLLPLIFVFSSCAKKYDWVCSCEIYTPTTSDVRTKEITNKSQSDANEECSKFGENEAGIGGAHDCNTKAK
jgi:hypothetical protein